MDRRYYTIGEVAEQIGEKVSLVRFWSESFSDFIQPSRNSRGNRVYVSSDIETFKTIHYLVKTCGLTLSGAVRRMKDDRKSVDSRVKAIGILKDIRAQLDEVRRSME